MPVGLSRKAEIGALQEWLQIFHGYVEALSGSVECNIGSGQPYHRVVGPKSTLFILFGASGKLTGILRLRAMRFGPVLNAFRFNFKPENTMLNPSVCPFIKFVFRLGLMLNFRTMIANLDRPLSLRTIGLLCCALCNAFCQQYSCRRLFSIPRRLMGVQCDAEFQKRPGARIREIRLGDCRVLFMLEDDVMRIFGDASGYSLLASHL